jgi:uncharacterized SAM-binding protein YcdF (DUF218 family)
MRKVFVIAVFLISASVAHIFYFIGQVQFYGSLTQNLEKPLKADGIIVVTGAPYRIEKGIDLLKEKWGKRLLISGVHPSAKYSPLLRNSSDLCCVDLDEKAENTRANVIESEKWIKDHNFHSIILVTSDYHMPRSIMEFHRVMPDLHVTPYSIIDPGTPFRFHVIEYVKYTLACLRTFFLTHI